MEVVVTKQVREGHYYRYRIVAVGLRVDGGPLKCPTLDFFQFVHDAHPNDLDKLTALLDRIAEQGPPRNEEKFKHLTGSDGIFEMKAGSLRLHCFWDDHMLIVCTNGSVKKSRKADPADIEAAEHWKRRYFAAKAEHAINHEPENA